MPVDGREALRISATLWTVGRADVSDKKGRVSDVSTKLREDEDGADAGGAVPGDSATAASRHRPSLEELLTQIFVEAGEDIRAPEEPGFRPPVVIVDISEKWANLIRIVGEPLAAYLVGGDDASDVRSWLTDRNRLRRDEAQRICLTNTLARELDQWYVTGSVPNSTIVSWFLGAKRPLDERSPADVIRSEPFRTSAPKVASVLLATLS